MKKKIFTSILLVTTMLTSAACSTEAGALLYDNSTESSVQTAPIVESNIENESLNIVSTADESEEESSATTSSDEDLSSPADSDVVEEDTVISSESTIVEDSIANPANETETSSVETTTDDANSETETTTLSSEQLRIASLPSTEASSSSTSFEVASFNNKLALDLMNEASPLINEASNNMFLAKEYFFTPVALDENTVEIEVRRQSPDNQGHANLITIYRYDAAHGHLIELNIQNNEWQDALE